MKCVLKTNDGVMIKSIDTANTTLELTTDVSEAYNYVNGEWFAKSELEFLQFHFKKEYPQVMNMHCEWVEENKDSYGASSACTLDAPMVGDMPQEPTPIDGEPMVGDIVEPIHAVLEEAEPLQLTFATEPYHIVTTTATDAYWN